MRTKPHTIRFDEAKLPLALKKSGLTIQKLIDKLISDFTDKCEQAKQDLNFTDSQKKEILDNMNPVVISKGGRNAGKTAQTQTWIEGQIKAINAEKIPKERDTQLGRQAWKKEQQKRIDELKNLK